MAFKIYNSIFSAIILYIDYYITTLYIEAVIRLWNRLRFDIKKYQNIENVLLVKCSRNELCELVLVLELDKIC